MTADDTPETGAPEPLSTDRPDTEPAGTDHLRVAHPTPDRTAADATGSDISEGGAAERIPANAPVSAEAAAAAAAETATAEQAAKADAAEEVVAVPDSGDELTDEAESGDAAADEAEPGAVVADEAEPGAVVAVDAESGEAAVGEAESGDAVVGEALSVVLVGPPGAGKSTIGRKLARELGLELFDTDAGIEERTGRSIPEIFAEDGEPEFRRIEEDVVREAVLAGRGIVSLGGGSVLSGATRELLRGRTVVYLEISVGEGLRRTGASTNRPLLAGDDPAKKYRELMKIRRPLYREVASVRVRTDGRSPGRVVRMIMAKLGVESVLPHEDPTPATPSPNQPPTSKSRSRRRRRRGRGDRAGATLMPKSPAAESDSAAPTAGEPAGTSTPAPGEPPKRARRNRRSRRRGRGTQQTAPATANGTTAATAPPAANGTADAGHQGANHGAGGDPRTAMTPSSATASPGGRSRRRRASRSAGSPTVSTNGQTTPQSTAPTPQPASTSTDSTTRGTSGSTPAAQQDSPTAGRPAAPGAGRSRRARARRAKARARDQSPENSGGISPAAPVQPRQIAAEADS